MSTEDLVRNYDFVMSYDGNRNINCGSLRRIGKTEALKFIIRRFAESNPERQIALMVPLENMLISYRDCSDIIHTVMIGQNIFRELTGQHFAVFADEIPDASYVEELHDCEFMGGFYSQESPRIFDSTRIVNIGGFTGMTIEEITESLRNDNTPIFHDTSAITTINSNTENNADPDNKYKFITGRQ